MAANTKEAHSEDLKAVLEDARNAQKKGNREKALQGYLRVEKEAADTDMAEDAKAFRWQMQNEIAPNYITLIAKILLVVGSLVIMVTTLIAFHSDNVPRNFLIDNWGWVLLAGVILIATIISARGIDIDALKLTESRQNFILAFGSIFLIMFTMGLTVFLKMQHRMFVYEILFILTACILPAATYYLFLKSRRPSILNEFISNLSRLGLLDRRKLYAAPVDTVDADGESAMLIFRQGKAGPPAAKEGGAVDLEAVAERQMRVNGYFQRFEALYGQLRFSDAPEGEQERDGFVGKLLEAVDDPDPDKKIEMPVATVYLADIFRANLVIPLGLATMLSLIGWFLVVYPQIDFSDDTLIFPNITVMNAPLNFAFLGAYFFGLQMLFRRFVRRDLGPNAYLAFATRIILAVVGVWVVVLCIPEKMLTGGTDAEIWRNALLVVAFTIGVFPKLLWKYIKAFFVYIGRAKSLLPNFGSEQPLSQLDGLTIWHEVRFEEEDVENVPNMATVDIVDLMLRTQTPPERLMAWIDQSILHCALGPGNSDPNISISTAAKLRSLGIRSATQFVASTKPQSVERTAVENALGKNSTSLPTLTCAIALEPNFHLMRNWRGI